jgi:hypothetical protein
MGRETIILNAPARFTHGSSRMDHEDPLERPATSGVGARCDAFFSRDPRIGPALGTKPAPRALRLRAPFASMVDGAMSRRQAALLESHAAVSHVATVGERPRTTSRSSLQHGGGSTSGGGSSSRGRGGGHKDAVIYELRGEVERLRSSRGASGGGGGGGGGSSGRPYTSGGARPSTSSGGGGGSSSLSKLGSGRDGMGGGSGGTTGFQFKGPGATIPGIGTEAPAARAPLANPAFGANLFMHQVCGSWRPPHELGLPVPQPPGYRGEHGPAAREKRWPAAASRAPADAIGAPSGVPEHTIGGGGGAVPYASGSSFHAPAPTTFARRDPGYAPQPSAASFEGGGESVPWVPKQQQQQQQGGRPATGATPRGVHDGHGWRGAGSLKAMWSHGTAAGTLRHPSGPKRRSTGFGGSRVRH